MLQFSIIGNLGRDAEVREANGKKFVSFNVAHTESYNDAQGVRHESTTWVSCILNGDGGALLPYLKKGKRVFVSGDGSPRLYSSKVQRSMVAGLDIAVRQIELLGGASDSVPRELVSPEGVLIPVTRIYTIDPKTAKSLGATKERDIIINDKASNPYRVSLQGIVVPYVEEQTLEQPQ